MTVMRKWSVLAAVLVLAVLAAGWFLLVSPKRGDAAALRDQKTQMDGQNASLQNQIAQLKAEAKDLPKMQAQLAVIHQQIPSDPQLPKMVRDLTALAKSSGAELFSIGPSAPVLLNTATAAGASAAAATTTSGTTSTTASAAAAVPTSQLYQVPVIIKASGDYYELVQFLNGVENLRRAYLFGNIDVSANQNFSADKVPDSPPTGALVMTLTGRVFVAAQAATTTATVAPATPAK